MTEIITIEHLPDRKLSPNARCHWAVKSKAVKLQREEVGWMAKIRARGRTPIAKAMISYTFIVKDKRHRDIDNLVAACKSFQDGLVDGGLLLKDDSGHLSVGFSRIEQGEKEMTIIKIDSIEEEGLE
jgi:crossover junction endodeoxyribonuclease RusA